MRSYTLSRLARLLEGEAVGDGDLELKGLLPLDQAEGEHLSFLANPRYSRALETTAAGAVIVSTGTEAKGRNLIRVGDPYLAFARAMELFYRREGEPAGVSPLAFVHPEAELGDDVSLAPFVVVSRGCRVGRRVTLMPGVYLGPGAQVGDDSVIHPNVVLEWGVTVGSRAIIHAGSVLGSDGYGFAPEGAGYRKIVHAGTVRVGDDVEIGANCTVDRAVMGETVIGDGCKMDNLVHLAHNVVLGPNCLMVGQSGIAGSTRLGEHVTVAAQSGVAGHLKLGDGAVVAAKTAVFKGLEPGARVAGIPAVELSQWKKNAAVLKNLDGLRKRIRELESRLAALEGERG